MRCIDAVTEVLAGCVDDIAGLGFRLAGWAVKGGLPALLGGKAGPRSYSSSQGPVLDWGLLDRLLEQCRFTAAERYVRNLYLSPEGERVLLCHIQYQEWENRAVPFGVTFFWDWWKHHRITGNRVALRILIEKENFGPVLGQALEECVDQFEQRLLWAQEINRLLREYRYRAGGITSGSCRLIRKRARPFCGSCRSRPAGGGADYSDWAAICAKAVQLPWEMLSWRPS